MAMTASPDIRFGFQLEYVDQSNTVVRRQPIAETDFYPAIRDTSFDASRQNMVDEYRPMVSGARIEPVFADESSAPQATGFRVTIPIGGGREHVCEYPISYFSPPANRLLAELRQTKVLASGQKLYYRLNAFLDDSSPEPRTNQLHLSLQPPQGIAIATGRRADFGPAEPWDQPSESDLPVLVERWVLEEAVAEARENPEREIGGFLLGRVLRDPDSQEVLAAITGLATAGGTTESSVTSVTFTPASFAQVRRIIQLRARHETVLGWYHSHPFRLCAECPSPTPKECLAKILFYSDEDHHLMSTTFDQPFMFGLLAAIEPRIETAVGHLPVKLYGWQKGEIKARGFEVVDTTDP
jgi:proteasome lid subunit RPN8/RPN11